MRKLHFCYSTSRTGLKLLCISMYSVAKYNKDNQLIFHILHSKLNNIDIEYVQNIFKKYSNIIILFTTVDVTDLNGHRSTRNLPEETLYRTLLSKYVGDDIDKILYLDIDTICCDSLWNLFNINIDNYYLAAVLDEGISDNYISELGYSIDYGYFNAGVLMINLRKWRSDNLGLKVISHLKERDFMALDQDALNISVNGKWKILPSRFNYMSPKVFKDMMFYGKKYTQNSIHPAIVHFVGPHKPWYSLSSSPYNKTFYQLEKECGCNVLRKSTVSLRQIYQFLKYSIIPSI